MTQPLALVFYENLLPGSQLVNRLRDLGYRVLPSTEASSLLALARQNRPLLMIIDLVSGALDLCEIIRTIRNTPETSHIPVLAFAGDAQEALRASARTAGATLVAGATVVLSHLPELLDQLVEMEP
jgi:CheY-like chemotaxis protein